MRFRNTIVLAVIVALVGAYLYWIERPAMKKESTPTRLLDVDPEEVTRLELETPEGTIVVERRDEGWHITAPIDAAADDRAVDTLVQTAAEAEEKRRLADVEDLSAFGLDEPAATLRLQGKEKAFPALAVGNGTPIGFNAYARRDDEDAVLLTGGTVRSALTKKLRDLRDKTVLQVSESDVSAIELKPRDGEPVRVERTESGWELVAPVKARASQTAVGSLLASLRALRAVDFVDETGDEAERKRGLAPPELEVVLERKEGDPLILRLGDEVEAEGRKLIPARRTNSSQIYLLASYVRSSLGKTADDLRDKTLLPIDADKAAEIRVSHADGESFTLVREEDAWTLSGEEEWETDPLIAKRLVDDLFSLKGDEVVDESGDLAAVGLDHPELTIEVLDGDGQTLGVLLAGPREEEGTTRYHAARKNAGPVFAIRDYAYRRIDKRPGDLITTDEDESITD